MSFLTLSGLCKAYGTVGAVADVSLSVKSGTRTAIVGPSGSGKSTLLRLIAGFEAPDAGAIALDGVVLADAEGAVPAHKRGIGIVSQDGSLFPHLNIADNIGFGLDKSMDGRAARIADLIAMVGLDGAMLKRKPDQLSGGQQQRVALARSLARKPKLMLLDEPFSALDTGLRASTRKAVSELLAAEGVTSILVTHDQAEALSFADQIGVMHLGRLLQVDSPQRLYRRPVNAMVAQFMGDAIILPAEASGGVAHGALGPIGIDKTATGPIRVMLRPEQIVLAAPLAGGVDAEVVEVDFSGTVSLLRLRVLDRAGWSGQGSELICLPRLGMQAFAPGENVSISVIGPAHALDAEPEA